jgi:hypothetical protein
LLRSAAWIAWQRTASCPQPFVSFCTSADRTGRRLEEIAVLRRGVDGLVYAVTCWHADRGNAGMDDLNHLLAARRRP